MNKIYVTARTDEIMDMVRDIAFDYGTHLKKKICNEESDYSLIHSRQWNNLKMLLEDEIESTCEHEMARVDDSFHHELGTEVAFHLECTKCGAEIGDAG